MELPRLVFPEPGLEVDSQDLRRVVRASPARQAAPGSREPGRGAADRRGPPPLAPASHRERTITLRRAIPSDTSSRKSSGANVCVADSSELPVDVATHAAGNIAQGWCLRVTILPKGRESIRKILRWPESVGKGKYLTRKLARPCVARVRRTKHMLQGPLCRTSNSRSSTFSRVRAGNRAPAIEGWLSSSTVMKACTPPLPIDGAHERARTWHRATGVVGVKNMMMAPCASPNAVVHG